MLSPSLCIYIAVPKWRNHRTVFLVDSNSHFHVAIQNISQRSIRLWSEACSWGYDALSFEIHHEGRVTSIYRKPIYWKQNTPDYIVLEPKELQIFDIYFASGEWPHFPLPPSHSSLTVALRAIYSVSPDLLTQRYNVWSGSLTSDNVSLLFVNHRTS